MNASTPTDILLNDTGLSDTTVKWTLLREFIINTLIIGNLCIFGIIGNVLVWFVLGSHRVMPTTSLILRCLAVADGLVLLMIFVLAPPESFYRYTKYFKKYHLVYPYIFKYGYPILAISRMASIWIVVMVTRLRYYAVCHPLSAGKLNTKMRMRAEILVCILICIAYNIPRFFEFGVEHKDINGDSLDTAILRRTDLVGNKLYTLGYRMILYFFTMQCVPGSILVVLNIKLVLALQRSKLSRQRMSSQELNRSPHASDAITKIVVGVVVVFMVCNIPAFIAHALWGVQEAFDLPELIGIRTNIAPISNALVTLNSACNIIIYCMCSGSFRRRFTNIFCCRKIRPIFSRRSIQTKSGSRITSPF